MDFIPLLSATVRLVDLHDSDREYKASPNYTKEARTGHSDGIYLDVAILIVECLRRLDDIANQEYLPFRSVFNEVRESCPEISDDDVFYVLNVLRRPTELYYLNQKPDFEGAVLLSEKRKTAIVEKTDYADEYRLTTTGRMFISLANAAKDATYLRGDAYNLLHAIEANDFKNVLTFSDEIVARVRGEILDVRTALEKVGRTEAVEKYIGKFDQYRKVIEETITIVQKSERSLENPDTLEAFGQWQKVPSNPDISFDAVCLDVSRVRQVMVVFNRAVAELVSQAVQNRGSASPPPSFIAHAIWFVQNPMSERIQNFLLQQWGAVSLETPFHSALDGLSTIKIKAKPDASRALVFDHDNIEPISKLGKLQFLDRHGLAIAEALKHGTVKLSDALDKGWFMVDEKSMLGDLIGVFVAPDILQTGGVIQIQVGSTFNLHKVDAGEFMFNELMISLKGASIE